MNQPQNLPADDLGHRASLTEVASLTEDALAAQVAVATPALATDNTTGVPASVQYADELTADALVLRLQAITRLGISLTPSRLSTLTAFTAMQPQADRKPGPDTTNSSVARADLPEEELAGVRDDSGPVGAAGAWAPPTAATAPAGNNKPVPATTVEQTAGGASRTSAGDQLPVEAGADQGAASGRKLVVVPEQEPTVGDPATTSVGLTDTSAPGLQLPDVRVWAGRLVGAVGEVLVGDRAVSQLVRFTDERVFAELNRRVRMLGLSTTASSRSARERCVVRSVRVCQPDVNVAEVAAHVRHGGRSRAVALRLEVRRRRWVCTALELG